MLLGTTLLTCLVLSASLASAADPSTLSQGLGLAERQLLQLPGGRFTGLVYAGEGLRSPPNATKRGTADTPNQRAFISPAQNQDTCSACVGFVVTAAAEAAINVYKRQNWNRLGLSEQDLSFCRLEPKVSCATGASYQTVVANINENRIKRWAARSCFGYSGDPTAASCIAVSDSCPAGSPQCCASQLPAGGALSMAYSGNPLATMAQVKEQIMLNGGVITSLALSNNAFSAFVENKTSSNGVFGVAEDLRDTARGDLSMHAVFCYGWWDNMSDANDGYWLCKNSWGSNWGLGGSFRAAYGAANLTQPDYTFALQYNRANPLARATQIRQQLKLSLAFESSSHAITVATTQ
ncbi:hypothetical protein OEZ85_002927 [Tetradesmus obliquus]|uniref:Peptidase C1A papain C-terminal domain-containing protein n=1 Tax=Tetradesmus obliquus TaxID=3088 RepID=A0ABY8TZ23_TETOB|nr:hypothetical protein OEZ85_002927 [Tetradesmus obliquus]